MAVTAASLAAALGITVADAAKPDDPGIVEAARLLDVAGELVAAYLRGGTAPPAIVDEATIRTAGHVQHRNAYGRAVGRVKAGGAAIDLQPAARSAVRQSGAAALLAPWVRRTA